MKLFVKYINFIIFFILVALFFVLSPEQKLSTNLLSLLPQNNETQNLKIYEEFKNSRKVLVAFKNQDIKEVKAFEKNILKHDFLKIEKNFINNNDFKNYIKEYEFYIKKFNPKTLDSVKASLEQSYNNLINNYEYNTINQLDPLLLFTKDKSSLPFSFKNGHIYLKNYGYMSIFSFEKNINYQKIYDIFHKNLNSNIEVFSPTFYFVENAKAIKSQVNYLILLSTFVLILLYVVILKNISLLVNTILTLLSSSIFASLLITFIWDEVSLFVLVFGMAVSTVSIDYMFHHYFCGYYEKKLKLNKPVFYGFFTTFLAFFILSFVDFTFIKQVSLFSIFAIGFSYISFAFIYPQICFTCKDIHIKIPSLNFIKNYKYFALLLAFVIGYNFLHVEVDFDIKNLDYQNTELKKTENFFKEKLNDKNQRPFILKAKSLDALIQKSRDIKALHVEVVLPLSNLLSKKDFTEKKELFKRYDFEKLKKNINHEAELIGFRKSYFNKAYSKKYLNKNFKSLSLQEVMDFGFDVVEKNGIYYTFGFSDTIINGVYMVNSSKFFKKSIKNIYTQLFISGAIILFFVFVLLLKVAKQNFFKVLSFILFPMALILSVIVIAPINILQIFMIFVIVSISIDYGIYMSAKDVDEKSQRAIIFSLFSTFAGFGVLIFSSIGTLFYIGEVATLGLLSILILLLGKK